MDSPLQSLCEKLMLIGWVAKMQGHDQPSGNVNYGIQFTADGLKALTTKPITMLVFEVSKQSGQMLSEQEQKVLLGFPMLAAGQIQRIKDSPPNSDLPRRG